MKKITLLLTTFLLAFTMLNAQDFTVLLVDNDNDETTPITTALTNSGYTYATFDIATNGAPTFEQMEQYDMVLWYTGNNGVTNLWQADNDVNSVYNDALVQFANNGGIVWVDGLDFLYDVVDGASDVFPDGSFIKDTLGISDYLSQSYADDGNNGVPQYDKSSSNSITTENPITWTYSTLWFADGLAITANANALYEMMGGAYSLAGQVTALYNQVGNSTFITSGFRLGKLNSQLMTDNLIKEIIDYASANWDTEATAVAPVGSQAIAIDGYGTELTVTETVGWDMREWKYSTTSGSGYQSFTTPETEKAYIPYFSALGTYYVVCETAYGSTIITSNEVQFNVVDLSCSISPADNQFILSSANGTQLSVTESPAADSREWKYSTTSGSGYISFATPETGTNYTPNFDTQGIYYVVCESNFGGTIITSNEVKVAADTNTSNYYLAFDGDDSFYVKDNNQDYINISGNYTIETWVKVGSYTSGTYPVIMDREKCFSMYVQSDGVGSDDFSIAFARRDATDAITASLSSADNAGIDFNFGEWYHVAVTYNGTDAKMFINGTEVVTSSDDFTLLAAASDYINIGCRYRSGYERFLTGSIENISISDVARYTSSFTPNFYAQQIADDNSVVCLNLENNGGTNLYDFSGHFSGISLRNSPNNADWKLKIENAVTPVDAQNVLQNSDGNILTVNENGLATGREWKYSTTSGSGYTSFGTAETATTYTPNFATIGTYYVVCVSNFNGTDYTSNEVQINVVEAATITTGTITGSPFTVSSTIGASVDVPYTITGTFAPANNFTAYISDDAGSFTTEVSIGTIATTSTGGTINATIPAGTASGTAYRIRVKSDNPVVTGTDNGVDFEVILVTSSIAPVDEQSIETNTDGTELTVTETPTAVSREWKYSETSGGTYASFGTPQTATTYTPNFAMAGVYYVVCESSYSGGITSVSNEVEITVTNPSNPNFKILLVDDDDYVAEAAPIETALTNSGFTWAKITTSSDGVPSYEDMEPYDMVLWYTGNDGTANLWQANADEYSAYNNALVQFAENKGIVWVDGLDYFYNILGSAPQAFPHGSFIRDTLGISDYLSQSYIDDGNVGVQQYDIVANPVTTQTPINWVYSTLWNADGLAVSTGTPMYQMYDDAGYPLHGQTTALYNELGTTTYITSGFRLGKISNQTLTDRLVFEILEYGGNNWDTESVNVTAPDAQTIYQNTDGTALTANESDGWDSREWKYSTTQGSGYVAFGTPETAKTYTPNFATAGTYYIICETTYGDQVLASNEVEIIVIETPTITTGTIVGSPFIVDATTSASVDVPYTITGTFDPVNNFMAYLSDETGDFSSEVLIGTLVTTVTGGTINATIPAGTVSGIAYRIRVKSDYPVIVGSDNGIDFEITNTTGISDINNEITIYPNPVTDYLYFENINTDSYKVKIFDNLGRLILEKENNNNRVNVSSLKQGIYTISISNKKTIKRTQFVKR